MSTGFGLGINKNRSKRMFTDMRIRFTIPAGGKTVSLPLTGNCNCTIIWGDGQTSSAVGTLAYPNANCTHTYAEGTYICKIYGTADRFGYSNSTEWEGGKLSPDIISFGKRIVSFVGAFAGCTLGSVPRYLPEHITSLSFMFSKCGGDISNCQYWNTSHITNMSRFILYIPQNPNIEDYDVSMVSDFVSFATGNSGFNQYIGKWKLRPSGTNMYGFANAYTTGWSLPDIERSLISFVNYVLSTYGGKAPMTPINVQLSLPGITLTSTKYFSPDIETYKLGESAIDNAISAHDILTAVLGSGAGWTITFG